MASSKSILDSPRSRPSATRIIFQCLHSTDIQKFLREQYDVNVDFTWIYNAIDYLNWVDYLNPIDESMVNKVTAERILCAGVELVSLVGHDSKLCGSN